MTTSASLLTPVPAALKETVKHKHLHYSYGKDVRDPQFVRAPLVPVVSLQSEELARTERAQVQNQQ